MSTSFIHSCVGTTVSRSGRNSQVCKASSLPGTKCNLRSVFLGSYEYTNYSKVLHIWRNASGATSRRTGLDITCSQVFESDDVAVQPVHHTREPPEVPGQPARRLSDVIIGINIGMFLAQLAFPQLTLAGVKINEMIDQGEVWRLFTPAFLHGSPTHLLVNMLSLHSLGPVTEWTCGRQRFLAIYLGSAVAGNIASYFQDDLPSLGASGAIFGLSGALLVYFVRNRRLFRGRGSNIIIRLVLTVILNFGVGILLPQIDEWGHLGGFLGGALLAYLLGPCYELCLVKGLEGIWLVDDPPLSFLSTPPRQIFK